MIEVPFLPNNLVIKNTKRGMPTPCWGITTILRGTSSLVNLDRIALMKLTLKGLTPFLSKMYFFADYSLYVAITFKPNVLLDIKFYSII